MKEVTKEEFYRVIREGKLDVIDEPRRIAPGEYANVFRFRDRRLFGEIRPEKELDRYPYYVKHYYLA